MKKIKLRNLMDEMKKLDRLTNEEAQMLLGGEETATEGISFSSISVRKGSVSVTGSIPI